MHLPESTTPPTGGEHDAPFGLFVYLQRPPTSASSVAEFPSSQAAVSGTDEPLQT